MATLKSPVGQWRVNNVVDYGETSQRLVVLYDKDWVSCRYAIQRDRWTGLDGEEGLKVMSGRYGTRLGALNAETNKHQLGSL